jgi:hypothetical protein
MLIRKARHEVIAMIIIRLKAELDAFVVASLLGSLDEVLGQQLALFVEIVARALEWVLC